MSFVALAAARDVSNLAAMVWTRWTDEQVKELLTRYDAGDPLMLIARSVGRSYEATRTKLWELRQARR